MLDIVTAHPMRVSQAQADAPLECSNIQSLLDHFSSSLSVLKLTHRPTPKITTSNPAIMKVATFSVYFALVASVPSIALPADDASSLVPREGLCTDACADDPYPVSCENEKCGLLVQ